MLLMLLEGCLKGQSRVQAESGHPVYCHCGGGFHGRG